MLSNEAVGYFLASLSRSSAIFEFAVFWFISGRSGMSSTPLLKTIGPDLDFWNDVENHAVQASRVTVIILCGADSPRVCPGRVPSKPTQSVRGHIQKESHLSWCNGNFFMYRRSCKINEIDSVQKFKMSELQEDIEWHWLAQSVSRKGPERADTVWASMHDVLYLWLKVDHFIYLQNWSC